ncbi:MAG: PAS domain-containing protein [Salinivirgaceae bacterium]|nr:PAS domain-containing protein [Salinivirgaceae bacterium]
MSSFNYFDEYPSAVTVCNEHAQIVYMNQKATATFEKWGGKALIGQSLYDCHNPKSVAKIKEILATGKPNTYTIEKNGLKKLIHQSPWFHGGKLAGLIEISIELPAEMPHFIRS